MPNEPAPVPLATAALLGRCPRCGQGALFRGLLDVRDSCESCGLDLRAHDAGDGPAVAAIFLIGAVAVGAAIWVDVKFAPPLWLHAVLWPALVLPFSVLTMRVAKAALVALQWRHRRNAP
ncbi:DUF983 domain-containing protein [Neoroseomonas rubea]|uniref:DUF983 domain-containing protein n=1 Tax=Neoroseomonas rubea TaxID=2748666 RepID=UPI0018DF440B|nr:DUF983 domain-containing protein [Roseomonas rubea]